MNSNPTRPYVLSIGGFDPCGGAGILADIKTLEAHGVFGLAIMTANTIQTEDSFRNVKAESNDYVTQQLDALLARYPIATCKIGLTASFTQLECILNSIAKHDKTIPIIWDPILRATACEENIISPKLFSPNKILSRLTLITPNIPEFSNLFPSTSPQQIAMQYQCALLLKGGHADNTTPFVEDTLYDNRGKQHAFQVPRSANSKHGTGCVLSSAIAAHLALGKPLPDAVRLAQLYVARFIASHPSRLGVHRSIHE